MVRFVAACAFAGLISLSASVLAEDLYLADSGHWPGSMWLSRDGGQERAMHRREVRPLSSAPGMIPRLSQVCVIPGNKLFLCSGLDGFVFHLLTGHEVVSSQIQGQIRDLAAGENDHTVYFSVVPTPQGGERLADGRIYRHDSYTGGPEAVATVRQDAVGGNWWGAFAMNDGEFYVATLGTPSRIYRLQGTETELQFETSEFRITGMSFAANGDLYLATGGKEILRLRDFRDPQVAFRAQRNVTDVALPPAEGGR